MCGCFSVVVCFVGYRVLFKDALPKERQRTFVPFPARATVAAIRLVARPVRVSRAIGRNVVSRRHDHRH